MGIYAKVNGEWKSVDGADAGLEGLGDWAEIASVTGMPNRYAYNDGIDWVAFEWTDTSTTHTLKTNNDGLVDLLIVGPGGGNRTAAPGGSGGQIVYGLNTLNAGEYQVIIEPYASNGKNQTMIEGPIFISSGCSNLGGNNSLGTYRPTDDDLTAGKGAFFSYITGEKQFYGIAEDCMGSKPNNPEYPQTKPARPGKGDGGGFGASSWNRAGTAGCVIVRVPASLAAGVDPTTYNDITTFDLAKQAAKDAAKSAVKEAVKDKRKKR